MIALALAATLGLAGLKEDVAKYLAEKDEAKAETLLKRILNGKPAFDKLFAAAEAYAPAWKHPGIATLFSIRVGKVEQSYRLLVPDPKTAKPGSKMPLLFALPPGSGKEREAEQGLGLYWREEGLKRGFLVLSPIAVEGETRIETEDGEWIFMGKGVSSSLPYFGALLAEVCAQYPVDRSRVYLAGVSAGGIAGWVALTRLPDLFQGALFFPGFLPDDQEFLGENAVAVPVFVGVGKDDDEFWIGQCKASAASFQKAGGKCELKEYAGQEHTIKVPPAELFDWLAAQKRAPLGAELKYRCAEKEFARCGWLEVLEMDESVTAKRPARVEATVGSANVVSLGGRGWSKVRIYLRHDLFDWTQPIVALVDGKEAFSAQVDPDAGYFLKQWKADPLRAGRYVGQIEVAAP